MCYYTKMRLHMMIKLEMRVIYIFSENSCFSFVCQVHVDNSRVFISQRSRMEFVLSAARFIACQHHLRVATYANLCNCENYKTKYPKMHEFCRHFNYFLGISISVSILLVAIRESATATFRKKDHII